MIDYQLNADNVTTDDLTGFFVGWPNPPSPATHLKLLGNSDYVVLARDHQSGRVVGFVTAISDSVLAAYVPLMEVLPEFQGRGIGKELVRRMLDQLDGLYMIDALCDENVVPFYERLGFTRATAVARRNYQTQSGRSGPSWIQRQ